jgi:hypothetical protein
MTITTTLNRLKQAKACADRYTFLLESLGGTKADHDAPINALYILENNGVADVEWLLRSSACIENPAPAWKAYAEAKATAWKAYEEAKAPAWKAYAEATATAGKAYVEATAPAWRLILASEI